jgi:hypothetical protein
MLPSKGKRPNRYNSVGAVCRALTLALANQIFIVGFPQKSVFDVQRAKYLKPFALDVVLIMHACSINTILIQFRKRRQLYLVSTMEFKVMMRLKTREEGFKSILEAAKAQAASLEDLGESKTVLSPGRLQSENSSHAKNTGQSWFWTDSKLQGVPGVGLPSINHAALIGLVHSKPSIHLALRLLNRPVSNDEAAIGTPEGRWHREKREDTMSCPPPVYEISTGCDNGGGRINRHLLHDLQWASDILMTSINWRTQSTTKLDYSSHLWHLHHDQITIIIPTFLLSCHKSGTIMPG